MCALLSNKHLSINGQWKTVINGDVHTVIKETEGGDTN